ncbi:MAG: response regulator, partial [Pedobacter sp.]
MRLNFRDYLTKKKKILIVEDEPMSVRLIQHLLKDYQFELVVAVDGFEAIEKFKKTSFSLVIMDLY